MQTLPGITVDVPVLRMGSGPSDYEEPGSYVNDIANSVPAVQGLPGGIVCHRGHRPGMSEPAEQALRRRRV